MTLEKQPMVTARSAAGAWTTISERFSGNPLGRRVSSERMKQRTTEHFNASVGDFQTPSPAECLLLQQAAKLLAHAERLRAKDVDLVIPSLGTVRRLLRSLRSHCSSIEGDDLLPMP